MAAESGEQEETHDQSMDESVSHETEDVEGEDAEDGDSDTEEEEEDEEDEEPKLKYARMTAHLGPLYRNGDATSAFLVAGDKMVYLESQNRIPNKTDTSIVYRNT
jgi:vacuolar protein sorting-associated protein 41